MRGLFLPNDCFWFPGNRLFSRVFSIYRPEKDAWTGVILEKSFDMSTYRTRTRYILLTDKVKRSLEILAFYSFIKIESIYCVANITGVILLWNNITFIQKIARSN